MMCDTHVLLKDNTVFFAKNSDREPGEGQLVVRVPPVSGDNEKKIKTTYITVDQSARRHGVILSKPFWMWGAEMGANDRGVVIGNEAIYSRAIEKKRGLIGMDLVRLGLERGDTADHALSVITELLEKHGQGGVCGFRDKMRYDNSFIIADPTQAWILETAGRFWVAKKVAAFGAISNCLTIGEDYDLASADLEDRAKQQGFFKSKGAFSFKKAFDTRLIPYFAASRHRLSASLDCLQQTYSAPRVNILQMMNNLRTHYDQGASPATGTNRDICMHAGGFIRRSQTCGSMAAQLKSDGRARLFFTGTSAPCMSLFKPVSFDYDIDFIVLNKDEKTVAGSLWQNHEYIHRRLIFMDKKRHVLQESIARTENEMLSVFEEKKNVPDAQDWITADVMARKWTDRCFHEYRHHTFHYPSFSLYGRFWKKVNAMDGLNI
jgi:dipeptidase